jgi:hypothetical protein
MNAQTLFDLGDYSDQTSEFSPNVDPFSESDDLILAWRDSVRLRLEAKRVAIAQKENRDRLIKSLFVIENSSTLFPDPTLPVIEKPIEINIDAKTDGYGCDDNKPIIEKIETFTDKGLKQKFKPKCSGCIGTYLKKKLEYYRYSCHVRGKVKHFHIGSVLSRSACYTVRLINRWILTEIPSRWILYDFFGQPDYPERDDDFQTGYHNLINLPGDHPIGEITRSPDGKTSKNQQKNN